MVAQAFQPVPYIDGGQQASLEKTAPTHEKTGKDHSITPLFKGRNSIMKRPILQKMLLINFFMLTGLFINESYGDKNFQDLAKYLKINIIG